MKVLALCATLLMFVLPVGAQDIPPTGRIAYVGADLNIMVFDPQTNTRVSLTGDAGFTTSGAQVYEWPTWSRDGQLAFFGTSVSATDFSVSALVSLDGEASPQTVYRAEQTAFTYAAWSRERCEIAGDCADLALLLSPVGGSGFAVRIVTDAAAERVGDADDAAIVDVGTGAPFYFSWDPTGTRLVMQRSNARVDVYGIDGQAVETTLSTRLGQFFAPAWSPIDDRILLAEQNEGGQTSDLVLSSLDSTDALVTDLVGPVRFSWSPDGNMVAYTDGMGSLSVLDVVSGDRPVAQLNGVFAFFWSPDSQYVAAITQADAADTFSAKYDPAARAAQRDPRLQWVIVNIESGAVERRNAFIPTESMIYLLLYFDQFAQSHSLWSPDSRYLVYGEQLSADEAVINILNVLDPAALPLEIAAGEIGIWSYQ